MAKEPAIAGRLMVTSTLVSHDSDGCVLTSSSSAFPAESSMISNPSIYLVDIRSGVSADIWMKENILDPGVYLVL